MVEETWLDATAEAAEAAALTAHLVSFRSYPGEEGPVQRAVAAWLAAQGLNPELQETDGDRPNVIARVENGPGPTLLLNGHVDTVLAVDGWHSNPWQGWREDDRLYGLGACDMKSGVAAAMLATRALDRHRDRWQGTIIFTSVVDEEAFSIGARALIAAGIEADFCVVTEASWERPALGSVGKLLVRTDVTGKAAHASWPADGINAAVEAARFVSRLDTLPLGSHPRLEATQCVLSVLSGNEQYVITVPEHARVITNRHIVPGESSEAVLDQMKALAESLDSPASFDFAIDPPFYPSWETDPTHPLVTSFSQAYAAEVGREPAFGYRGFGDANLFSGELGIPTIQFGPNGANFHQANEWVSVRSIAGTIRVLVRLALDLLSDPGDRGERSE